jgi:Caspase domain
MADGRYALVVASSHYSDATLSKLEAPEYDARSLAAVLATPDVGDFDVTTLTDEPASKVTQEIEAFFDGRRREDLVLLYFSGHGILDEGARLYFATTDTRVDRPRSTSVSADFVNELMSECRSRRQVLVLDCCNSGAFARGMKAGGSVGTGERFEGRGRVVITASDSLQYAFEGDRVEGEGVGSVFTQALIDGLKSGNADLNGDGNVTLDELYDYVYGRVLDASPTQRPRKWAFGVEGQIFIARTTEAPAISTATVAAPPATEPAPAATTAKAPHPRGRRKRTLVWAGAAVALAAALAIAAVFVLRGSSDGSGDNSSSSSSGPVSSLAPGRDVALSVDDAWQEGKLDTVPSSRISAGARRALNQMPIEPVTPVPPSLDSCYGEPDEVTCAFHYPGLDLDLQFTVLQYPTGLRVADVRCYNSTTGNLVEGGIAACAQMVESS